MKELFYFLAAASVLAVACAKEEAVKENTNENRADGKVTLTASMPQFTDAETKASVSDAGVFSWTAGDIIDVVYEKSGSADKTYQFECTNASTGEFTNVDAIDDGYSLKTEGNVAFYPHEYTGTPSNQTFGSPEAAAKGFQMHATYSAGELAFVHDNAMMKVTVTNVPYFAGQLVVGSAKVNLSYAEDQASATYYVPVAASASAKLNIAVKDAADNSIISKSSQNEVAIVAANFYNLPTLAIGPVILIKNNVKKEKGTNPWTEIDNADGRINLHTYISGERDFTSYSNSTCQFNEITISGDSYVYYVYPADYKDRTVHVNIRCLGYDYPKLEADIVLSTVTEYEFGFAEGLKKAGDKFIYAIFEGSDTAKCKVYVEQESVGIFGSWWDTTPTQTTVMYYNDGSEKRFLNIYDITSCSTSATFEPVENGNKYYMYDWSWASKVSFEDAGGIKDYYLVYKWEDPDHHVYNKDFDYIAELVY